MLTFQVRFFGTNGFYEQTGFVESPSEIVTNEVARILKMANKQIGVHQFQIEIRAPANTWAQLLYQLAMQGWIDPYIDLSDHITILRAINPDLIAEILSSSGLSNIQVAEPLRAAVAQQLLAQGCTQIEFFDDGVFFVR